MKLNKKGVTIVEIIISIALISMVLIFLVSMLIRVNDMNKNSEVNSTYLISKALVIKNIEDDLKDVTSVTVSNCSISDFNSSHDNTKPWFCVKFNYEGVSTPGYLAIYYSNKKTVYLDDEDDDGNLITQEGTYVISYYHGSPTIERTLPDFEKYNITGTSFKYLNNVSLGSDVSNGFYKLEIPIIGCDGKDYSIIISYYGTVTVEQ